MEKYCYLGDTVGAIGSAFGSVITSFRSGWCKFRDLVPLLTRCLSSGAKGRLYFACVHSVMLYENEIWSGKLKDVAKLERNDARIRRLMCNVRPDDRTSTEELKTRLKLKIMRERLQHRRLQWISHPYEMEENAWSRIFKVSGSFRRWRPTKHEMRQSEVI